MIFLKKFDFSVKQTPVSPVQAQNNLSIRQPGKWSRDERTGENRAWFDPSAFGTARLQF